MNDYNLEKRVPFEPNDDRINRDGRPKGSRNRSTIVREWLEVQQKVKNPITGETATLDQFDMMTLAAISKARKGDIQAYKEVSQYMPDNQEKETDTDVIINTLNLRDTIIQKHYEFFDKGYDWNISSGGSRSGKTFNFLKWAFLQTKKERFDLNIIAPFRSLHLK